MSISRAPPEDDRFRAAAAGDPEWMELSLKDAAASPLHTDRQGLSVLHVACLHGQLTCVKRLVESGLMDVNSRCDGGRRPVHVVLSARSSPNSCACLEYLIHRGADVNVATTSGVTPLHLAAALGLRACTEMLVHAGADVHARDEHGNTPLDMARSRCHRAVARYLKDCMWKASKERELEMSKQVQILYRNLVLMSKLDDGREKERRASLRGRKMEEWFRSKGLPLLPAPPASRSLVRHVHSGCLLQDPPDCRTTPLTRTHTRTQAQGGDPRKPGWNPSTKPSGIPTPPLTSISRPSQVVLEEDGTVEDLRGLVTLSTGTGGRPQYSTRWENSPRRAPDLPLNTLERSLFPKAFPGRLASPRDYGPCSVLDLPRRGRGPATSHWTEVELHLPEVLESRHS